MAQRMEPQKKQSSIEEALSTFQATRNIVVIFILMVFLGFPGTLKSVLGGSICKLLETAAFGLQFLLIVLASGDDVMDVKLVDLRQCYWVIYLYLVYVALDSVLVSINRKLVIISVVHFVLTAMFALWLIEQYSPNELLELLFAAVFMNAVIVLGCTVVFPKVVLYRYHGDSTLRGLFSTKNEYGMHMCYGILTQVVLLRARLKSGKSMSIIFLGSLGVQFFMLVMTRNMGSLLSSVVVTAYMIYYSNQKNKQRLPLGLLFIAVSIGFLFFALTVLQALGPFLESLGKDASLTGRVPLWERALEVMTESHTMTGYGYLMFWRTPSAADYFRSGFDEDSWAGRFASSMHNMLVEMWADTGLISIVLLVFMLLTAERGIRYLTEEQYLFSSSFFTVFTVSMLTERGMDSGSVFTLTLFMVLGMMYQARENHRLEQRRKARVYVSNEPDQPVIARDESSDLAAFQQRFSSIADQKKAQPRPNPREFWDEPEEKKKTLDDLFQEIGGDDW